MVDTGTNKAVFLDRDGVIVIPEFREGRSFAPRRLEDFCFYPEAASSLQRIKDAGYLLVLVSNQPDVGAGVIRPEVLSEMNRRILDTFPFDSLKVCTHTRADNCDCRKPKPGMLIEAARELSIDLSRSFMVGDRASDVEAGHAVACRTLFIDLDYSEPKPTNAHHVVASVKEAADIIVNSGNIH
jgi:D-glycero-D-manno-heptose 1,7-bisphosphate phosphatase